MAKAAANPKHLPVTDFIAPVYNALHDDIQAGRHTQYFLPGGRGSGKSSFISLELIDGIMKDREANGIVLRAVGATLRDSVFAQCQWAIDTLGVAHLWRSTVAPMQLIFRPTGQAIYFRGLDDSQKLKSIRPRFGRFKYLWCEEFCELKGPNEVRSVMQSVVRGGEGFRIFASFNPPISRANWANEYILTPNDRATVFKTDYTMIPPEWLGEDFILEAEHLRTVNETAYRHEYLGEPVGDGAEVFENVEAREITDDELNTLENFYVGLDFGFATDPLAVIKCAYRRKTDELILADEIRELRCSNERAAELIKQKGFDRLPDRSRFYISPLERIPMIERQTITADSAEPKSIADLNSLGLKVQPAIKFPGCVRHRVRWLQHRKIIVDPRRTPYAYKELTNYQYLRTRDGEITSDLPDKDNNFIDSICYACQPLIFTRGITA